MINPCRSFTVLVLFLLLAATSDTGPCNAMAAGMAADHPLASCCVCTP